MDIQEYKKLIESQKTALQNKVDAAIKQAVDFIKTEQTCLLTFIESHPRIEWKFEFEELKIHSTINDEDEYKEMYQGRRDLRNSSRNLSNSNGHYRPQTNYNNEFINRIPSINEDPMHWFAYPGELSHDSFRLRPEK